MWPLPQTDVTCRPAHQGGNGVGALEGRGTTAGGEDAGHTQGDEGIEGGGMVGTHVEGAVEGDNETIKRVCLLVRYHDDRPAVTPRNVRRAISRIGVENMEALFAVKRADTLAQSMYERQKKLSYIDAYEETKHEAVSVHCLLSCKLEIPNSSKLL